jgi:hypothetical protein
MEQNNVPIISTEHNLINHHQKENPSLATIAFTRSLDTLDFDRVREATEMANQIRDQLWWEHIAPPTVFAYEIAESMRVVSSQRDRLRRTPQTRDPSDVTSASKDIFGRGEGALRAVNSVGLLHAGRALPPDASVPNRMVMWRSSLCGRNPFVPFKKRSCLCFCAT